MADDEEVGKEIVTARLRIISVLFLSEQCDMTCQKISKLVCLKGFLVLTHPPQRWE